MITAVVLTHNDATIIDRTLRSLTWCDELIVLDDESSDTTLEKVKKFKARIISHPLSDDFAKQRNLGLQEATGEWVLFVDSDEVVTEELAKEIREATSASGSVTGEVGFFLKRTDHMWGMALNHGETADVKLLRLGKKGSGEWTRPVHEVWNIKGEMGTLHAPLLHFPHPTIAEFIGDVNRYSTLNATMLALQKTPVAWWHIVAFPVAKFFRNYFFLLGFLDGVPGFCMAMIMSLHSFLTRSKLYMHYYAREVPLP